MLLSSFLVYLFIFFDEKFLILIGYIYQITSLSFKGTLPYIKHSPIFSSKSFNVASHIQAFRQPWVDFSMLCETGSNCQLSLFPHRSLILWAHFLTPPHCSIRFPVIYQGSHKHRSVPVLVFWSWYLAVQSLSHVWLFATPWLQHARLPCPLLSPGAYSNSRLSCWWCHPTISSSVIPFSSCLQSFPAWVSSSHQVARVLELQLQHQSFQWIFRTDFL